MANGTQGPQPYMDSNKNYCDRMYIYSSSCRCKYSDLNLILSYNCQSHITSYIKKGCRIKFSPYSLVQENFYVVFYV